MAKPKKEEASPKATGNYLDANFIRNKKIEILSLSPAADQILGGGIPSGSAVLISGHEGLGKTTAALQIGADAQRKGRVVVYSDIEERFKKINLASVKDFDDSPEMFKLIASSPGDMLYAQDHLSRAEKALVDFPGCVLILDSLSALLPKDDKGEDLGKGFRLSARKIEGDFYKRVAALKRVNDCIVIAIAHIASNIGSPGYHDVTAKYTQYAADVKIKIGYPPKGTAFEWKAGEEVIGHCVKWEVEKSALGAGTGTCVGKLRYGTGFDATAEIIALAESLAIIEKGGAWYTVPGVEKKFQGMEALCQALENDQKLLNSIHDKVRAVLYEG